MLEPEQTNRVIIRIFQQILFKHIEFARPGATFKLMDGARVRTAGIVVELMGASIDSNDREPGFVMRRMTKRSTGVGTSRTFGSLIQNNARLPLTESRMDRRSMATWIGLFRGINVGGRNILPMPTLKSDLESLKLSNVRTYVQSGNVIFDSTVKTASSLNNKIGARIEEQHGFRPHLLLLNRNALQAAIRLNPFPRAVSEPKSLHFFFLAEPATDPDLSALDYAKTPTESYKLTDQVFYLHAPDGIGRSKLAAKAEKHLGVVTTARNYRTVDKLLSMVMQSDP